MTIPASLFVNVTPSVLSAGGNALQLISVCLTENTRVPIGSVLSFPTAAAVGAFFGLSSAEASTAAEYFAGFLGATATPGALLFAQYPASAVTAWLRGGNISALTVPQQQSLSGTIALTVNGTLYTSASISLTGTTGFSDTASIIQAAFTSPPFAVTYDSVSGALVFTSTVTGTGSTITYSVTGTLATALALTQATGATLSQGAAAVASQAAFMAGVTEKTTNWATFFTMFDPDGGSGNTLKMAFANWTGTTNNRYVYICWDGDITPTESANATTSMGYLLAEANTSGTILIYDPANLYSPFVGGMIASIDFNATNGRIDLDFKGQSGLVPNVTDETTAVNLVANGYNFYGDTATANQPFKFFSPGSISGPYQWADSYVNQIWLNNQIQLAMMTLLTSVKSLPYNTSGYTAIYNTLASIASQGLTFGAIRPGVSLSASQIAAVNAQAGLKIDGTLASIGWYAQVGAATPQVRAARKSPPISFFYMDGGSIQQINLASVEVQ